MSTDRRIGVLTPSSNTHVEPTTARMLAVVGGLTAHFTRFPLPKSLEEAGDPDALIAGALMLADAQVEAIVFHGTVGSWLGLATDRALAESLTVATDIPATTATLATIDALRAVGAQRIGLAFPGPAAIADRIAAVYGETGLVCVNSVAAGHTDNHAVAAMDSAAVRDFMAAAAHPEADAVAVIGTNFPATPHVAAVERTIGIPVIDSTAAVTWKLLRMLDFDVQLPKWGRLFKQHA